jgi:hypothetical protein
VTAVLALTVGSATLVAVTVRLAKLRKGFGGAVYFSVVSIEPMILGSTPGGGVNDHATVVFVVPLTVAENCRVVLMGRIVLGVGLSAMVTAPRALPCFVNSRKSVKKKTSGRANACRDLEGVLEGLGRLR